MASRRARSALVAMVEIARLARGRPLPAKALTAQDGAASRQLESVLQDLVRGGLLRSVRGPRGGYELARERRRISAGDILRLVDGPPATAPGGTVDAILAAAESASLAFLDGVTLEELCGRAAPASADADFHI